jgi:predicted alpha/beta-fold hydrolase
MTKELMGYFVMSLKDNSEKLISKKSKIVIEKLLEDDSIVFKELLKEDESNINPYAWYVDHKDGTHVGIFKSNDKILSLYQNNLFIKTALIVGK